MADLAKLTADFVTSTLSGALAAGATTATIGSGLDIPATNGVLHLDYTDALGAGVGADNGPETITYATYTTGTGALAGMTRGVAGTTDVAHANGALVSAGISVEHLNEYDRKNASDQTIIGKNDYRATRFVPLTDPVVVVNGVDPANTDWTDVDVTANTSANTYAICGQAYVKGGATVGRTLYMRPNGSSATDTAVAVAKTQVNNIYCVSGYCVGVDTGQVFEYSVSDADVSGVYITVTGYWEYVD